MNGWVEGIQNAIAYIEENLTEELDICDIAEKAHISAFYFQKIFTVLCGITVGEYIRKRRLTRAAEELTAMNVKVIDVAVEYGYDSPDSFARAFTKFHGITPSAAKEKGASLQHFAPLQIKIILEGGSMMEYRIVEKAAFTVIGKIRTFQGETAYEDVPKFWQEQMGRKEIDNLCGVYGICMDSNGKEFDYMIADDYIPWKDIPEGFVVKVIPAGTWAVFPCRGALPETLQNVNTDIWKEWLPNCKEYKLAGNYNVELYTPMTEKTEDNYSEIWIPVEKVATT